MSFDDSDDYELLPHKELEDLRKEIIQIKHNPYGETEQGKTLLDSMDRLNTSITKLVSILEDAQKDLVEEYHQSKPAEKLNKILEQNEMIAKALLSVNDTLQSTKDQITASADTASTATNVNISSSNPGSNPSFQSFDTKDFVDVNNLKMPQSRPIPQMQQQSNQQFNPQFSPMQQSPMMQQYPPMQNSMQQYPSMQSPMQQSPMMGGMQQYPMMQGSMQQPLPPLDLSGLPPLPPARKKVLGVL